MERTFANIALIGMMGSGKSAVGRILAERLGWRFIDTDARIVADEGRPIADVFAAEGEEHFRGLESEAVRGAVSGEGAVIATGGGAVLRAENRAALWGRCFVVWLAVSPEETVARVARGERRPVLEREDDPLEAARRVLEARRPLYARADGIEETVGRAPEQIAESILARWRRAKGHPPGAGEAAAGQAE